MTAPERSGFRKTCALMFGIFLPILAFVANHCFGRFTSEIYPDYDSRTFTMWLGIATVWEVHCYFYPLIVWAMVALIADLFSASVRYSPWVRTGLFGGCIISGIFAALYLRFAPCTLVAPLIMLIFGPLALSPLFAFVTFLIAYRGNRREYRDVVPRSQRKSLFIPTSLFSLYGMASATAAFQKMQQLHAALPKNPPDCYLATAAGMAHPAIVRSRATMTVGGKSVVVTSQLQSLKALEIAVMVLLPGAHGRIRRLYDRVGPRLAGRCRRHTATALYLLLLPITFVSRGFLRLMFRDARRIVDDAYRS